MATEDSGEGEGSRSDGVGVKAVEHGTKEGGGGGEAVAEGR